MRTRAFDIQVLTRGRDRPVIRTSAAFSRSDGSGRGIQIALSVKGQTEAQESIERTNWGGDIETNMGDGSS